MGTRVVTGSTSCEEGGGKGPGQVLGAPLRGLEGLVAGGGGACGSWVGAGLPEAVAVAHLDLELTGPGCATRGLRFSRGRLGIQPHLHSLQDVQ